MLDSNETINDLDVIFKLNHGGMEGVKERGGEGKDRGRKGGKQRK